MTVTKAVRFNGFVKRVDIPDPQQAQSALFLALELNYALGQ